jgi:phosphohistidine phosphatase
VRLYLVRHTEAARSEPDDLRPLNPAGREAARALGARLAAEGVRPETVLTSPLLRARETGAEL